MSVKKAFGSVVPFMARRISAQPGGKEIYLGTPPRSLKAVASRRASAAPIVDLTGKPKVWFTIGPGRVGKTFLLRYAIEEVSAAGGKAICAAADPQNRSLTQYFEGVAQPPTNDPVDVVQWLSELLDYIAQEKMSAFVDLGGGDTSLGRLVDQMPDLVPMLEAEGIAVVAMYVLGPRADDMTAMNSLEEAGFKPPATGLVLNHGLEHPGTTDPFAVVVNHSVYRAAIDRGAVELHMPKLMPDLAHELDVERLSFAQAAKDGKVAGFSKKLALTTWINSMNKEFAPVRSWLP